jgi:hypothetical protein
MPSLEERVRHDVSSLYQFVTSITDLCERRNPAAAYLASSEKFFAYIVALGQATRNYIRDVPGTYKSPSQLLNLRDTIPSLRIAWECLHSFVKPALDSDTLHLPNSLIQGLTERFREIPGYALTEFVIYHTDDFNYFNVQLDGFKRIANSISQLIQGPPFPPDLALIGIPYSQASTLFMNCLIPHEMGHHVFGTKSLGAHFRLTIEKELQTRYGPQITPVKRSAITSILVKWLEELFCDLFAVRLVGYCYSFAFIEFFDTSRVLDESGALTRYSGMTDFDEYPPDLFRLQQQGELLKKDKWMDELSSAKCHYIDLLREIPKIKSTEFSLPTFQLTDASGVSVTFFTVLPTILTELDGITAGVPSGLEDWKKTHIHIEDYLKHGIVPSSLLETGKEPKLVTPSLVSLLNSSYQFYVESLDDLLNNIEGADVANIGIRSEWATKVQTWTSKALEDVGVLKRKGTA